MKKKLVEALMKQASLDSVIEVECPKCGAPMTAEPDAREFYCEECD